jgi:Zn-dependent protease/predicted transcriptional regulator
MKWSFEVTRLFGIPLKIHVTFLLLLLFVAMGGPARGGAAAAVNGVVTIVFLFVCVVIHELAHSLMAIRYGVNVRAIVLLPIGGVSQMEEMPEDPKQEIKVSVAGPLTSLALGALFYVFASLTGQKLVWSQLSLYSGTLLVNLSLINLMLGLFNILPAFPMDGGRVLRGILATRMDHTRATKVAVEIGQAVAILMFFFGIFYNWWLALIAIFIYLGAEGEEHATMLRAALRKVPVSRAMLTPIETVAPQDSLGSVVEKACHRLQADFPVVVGDDVVGILPKEVIFAAIHEKPAETPVSEIMKGEFVSATTDETLDRVFQKMQGGGISLVPVIEGGRLMGMINLEQIGKYHMMCDMGSR